MTDSLTRRKFLESSVVASAGLYRLLELSPATAEEARVTPEDVQLTRDIQPLVSLIEDTPQDKAVAMMIEQLSKKGVSYRQFVGALILAASRMNVSPHHVFMIHAAQKMSLNMRRDERLLPLFWALHTIQHNRSEGPRYPKVDVLKVASVDTAATELNTALELFDVERAESAAITLSRSIGTRQTMARLFHYAARDDSYIGHRIIAISNAWRTLDTIGWRHAEPLFQFVIRMCNTERRRSHSYRANVDRSKQVNSFPAGWTGRRADEKATLELLALMHEGDEAGACRWVFDSLKTGSVQAATIWDAIYLCGAEFMIRFRTSQRIAGRPLHTNTSMNSMRFAFDICRDPATRLYLLLQGVAWTTGFIATETKIKYLRDLSITEMPEVDIPSSPAEAVEAIFAEQPSRVFDNQRKHFISRYVGNRDQMDKVSHMAFTFGNRHSEHHALYLQTARLMTCLKATHNAHDMKFPAAIFESYHFVSPRWKPHMLAASTHWIHGNQMADNAGVLQAREFLANT